MGVNVGNPELAAVLRRIAAEGSKPCTKARSPQPSWTKVQSTHQPRQAQPGRPGGLPAKKRGRCATFTRWPAGLPACAAFRPQLRGHRHRAILGILKNTDAAAKPLQDGLPSADWLHRFLPKPPAWPLPTAPGTWPTPTLCSPRRGWTNLLAPAYLAERAKLIGRKA